MKDIATQLVQQRAAATRAPEKRATGKLGTQMRGKLQQDYQARGKTRYNLWYHYSPKARADVTLHGDAQYYHFLLAEFDPLVTSARYDIQQDARRIVGEELGQIADVEICRTDGSVVWRCVRYELPGALALKVDNLQSLIAQRIHAELPMRIETVTMAEVVAKPVRLQNCHRLLPYLAQARDWPLHEFENEVATLLHTRDEVALSNITALAAPGMEGLYVAALVRGLQFGRFRSNLDEVPWGWGSRFWSTRS